MKSRFRRGRRDENLILVVNSTSAASSTSALDLGGPLDLGRSASAARSTSALDLGGPRRMVRTPALRDAFAADLILAGYPKQEG